ncbi:MAG: hypothetical protein AAB112_03240, partial [Thermodesulfobacteriota bacterium]
AMRRRIVWPLHRERSKLIVDGARCGGLPGSVAKTVARMSLASALGGILGSMLIERWGGAFLMQFCGWVTIAMIFFFVFLIRRHGRRG